MATAEQAIDLPANVPVDIELQSLVCVCIHVKIPCMFQHCDVRSCIRLQEPHQQKVLRRETGKQKKSKHD